MERKIVYSALLCMLVLFMFGCQETPDESTVVSKADGISEDVIEFEKLIISKESRSVIERYFQENVVGRKIS